MTFRKFFPTIRDNTPNPEGYPARRTKRITAAVTPDEKAGLETAADTHGMTHQGFVRAAALACAGMESELHIDDTDVEIIPALKKAVRRAAVDGVAPSGEAARLIRVLCDALPPEN